MLMMSAPEALLTYAEHLSAPIRSPCPVMKSREPNRPQLHSPVIRFVPRVAGAMASPISFPLVVLASPSAAKAAMLVVHGVILLLLRETAKR